MLNELDPTTITVLVAVAGVVVSFVAGRSSAITSAKKDGITQGTIIARLDGMSASQTRVESLLVAEQAERSALNDKFNKEIGKLSQSVEKAHSRIDAIEKATP